VVDPGFNAILIRLRRALAELAEELWPQRQSPPPRKRARRKARAAFAAIVSETEGWFLCLDRAAGGWIESRSVGGPLPLFAGLGTRIVTATMRQWRSVTASGFPRTIPPTQQIERRRYWRGPCWLIVNTMLADGLRRRGARRCAKAIAEDSLGPHPAPGLRRLRSSTGRPRRDPLHWTAAMVLIAQRWRQ
jgi:hypothetical protein